jgi:naringenin degradation protein FdeH
MAPRRLFRSANGSRIWALESWVRSPPRSGTRFAVIDFPPGNQPHMHRTETIDYVIVMEGEIEIDMDASTTKLKAGDIVAQRCTNHAWTNRSGRRARVAFVLIDAEPVGIGTPVTGLHNAR